MLESLHVSPAEASASSPPFAFGPSAIISPTRRGTASAATTFDWIATRRNPVSALSQDQILEKAKELCRCEGKAWNLDDFKNGVSGVTMLTVVADDKDRAEYLRRATAFLKEKHRPV
jgi:hypothetical protein